jgi:hypothetical protein
MSTAGRIRRALGVQDLQGRLDGLAARMNTSDDATREALLRIEQLLIANTVGSHARRNRGIDQAIQQALRLLYGDLIVRGLPLPTFADAEMRFYSQTGEDGIIQLLLAAVGTATRKTVEICAGNGIECNSANLIINSGWTGLLVDGGEALVTEGRSFYEHGTETWYWPPTLRQAWITRDTINQLVTDAGFAGEIDLLTIDLDGVDYWIWEALDCVRPRVVVVEFNACWPADKAVTVPYSDSFVWEKGTLYIGASLAAMCKLAERKGFRLVGTNRYGFNAFFIRDDLARGLLPAVDLGSLLSHPGNQQSRDHLDTVVDREWISV